MYIRMHCTDGVCLKTLFYTARCEVLYTLLLFFVVVCLNASTLKTLAIDERHDKLWNKENHSTNNNF